MTRSSQDGKAILSTVVIDGHPGRRAMRWPRAPAPSCSRFGTVGLFRLILGVSGSPPDGVPDDPLVVKCQAPGSCRTRKPPVVAAPEAGVL